MSFKIKSIKNRAKMTCNYTRLSYHQNIYQIIKILKFYKNKNKYFTFNNVKIKTATHKNNLFVKNYEKNNKCKCDICGLEAKYFVLEKAPNVEDNVYHFNLYTIDKKTNNEIYFNIDHVQPRSKGGKNEMENLQLTCEICNSKKGNKFNIISFLLNKFVSLIKCKL